MYLRQIELHGFKSFAEPTTISFVAGVDARTKHIGTTAIVGPNGSGKSNVSDAIRWVMGEQSMKSLRGKKSDDVIFSGSKKKGKMSLARVALTFDNHDHTLPVEYDDVTIERKMYRNGEGEYRINGARVRLLDVVDILAKAGIGKGSHCVVGQGMADAILNATPQERRQMIEDAAGVKHDQIRKKRAEQKLARTKENLTRTKELIREVEPRVKLLKRQAEKAKKSKVIYEELRTMQQAYFGMMHHQYLTQRTKLQQEKDAKNIVLKNAQRVIDHINDRLSAETKKMHNSAKMSSHEAQKKELYQSLRTYDQRSASLQGRIEVAREKKAMAQRRKSIPVDLLYVQKRLDVITKNHAAALSKLETITDITALDELRDLLSRVHKDIQDLHHDAGKKTVTAPQDHAKEKIEKLTHDIKQWERAYEKLEAQRKRAAQKLSAVEKKILQEAQDDQQAREQFFALEKKLRHAQDDVDRARKDLHAVQIELARLDVHEADLAQEVREELHCDVTDLAPDTTAQQDQQKMRSAIVALKREYERVGGIDPMVVDEYKETQERYDFLTTEVADLDETLVQLRAIIKEMDKKIHQAFFKAYKEIDKEFTKYFRILFGGGNASLKKVTTDRKNKQKKPSEQIADATEVDDDTPQEHPAKAEIGVELLATPPGKKITQLSLLSGGERSLTSIAMLFAIIAYNPPPFIVLDEVEAALDEANSRRLAKIFAQLSRQTQFIIITHNRETMRHADMLYGVTMGNDGMSQILSVQLDHAQEKETS